MQYTTRDMVEYVEGDTEPCWAYRIDKEADEQFLNAIHDLQVMTDSRNRWRQWALWLLVTLAAHWFFLVLAIVF